MLEKGYDICYSDPGKHNTLNCATCNAPMEVKRDIMGPTSFAEAVGKGKHLHDEFKCPHAVEDWHIQVRELRKEIKKTPSKAIELILREEIGKILETKSATKVLHDYRS